MKKRKTTERWLADLFKDQDLERRADRRDRQIDHRVGQQIRDSKTEDKTPQTDWRTLRRSKS